jgi:hypothetical protein
MGAGMRLHDEQRRTGSSSQTWRKRRIRPLMVFLSSADTCAYATSFHGDLPGSHVGQHRSNTLSCNPKTVGCAQLTVKTFTARTCARAQGAYCFSATKGSFSSTYFRISRRSQLWIQRNQPAEVNKLYTRLSILSPCRPINSKISRHRKQARSQNFRKGVALLFGHAGRVC